MDYMWNQEFVSTGCYSNVCRAVGVRNPAPNAALHSVVVNDRSWRGVEAEFRRLAANVVYPDFVRLLLVTSEPSRKGTCYAPYISYRGLILVSCSNISTSRRINFYDFLLDPISEVLFVRTRFPPTR